MLAITLYDPDRTCIPRITVPVTTGSRFGDQELCFPEIMRENGYRTAAIGKMHFTTQFVPKENEEDDWPEDNYGFDIIHTTCDTKTGEYLTWLRNKSEKDYEVVKMQGERKAKEDRASASEKDNSGPPQVYPSEINPEYHQSAWIADRTIDLIREADPEHPFFALCSFVDPHHPFDPPAPVFDDVRSGQALNTCQKRRGAGGQTAAFPPPPGRQRMQQ